MPRKIYAVEDTGYFAVALGKEGNGRFTRFGWRPDAEAAARAADARDQNLKDNPHLAKLFRRHRKEAYRQLREEREV